MSERPPETVSATAADPARSGSGPASGTASASGSIATASPAGGRFPWSLALVGLIAAAALAFWIWQGQERTERLERDLARRVQAVELRDQQREEQLRVSQDVLRDAQAKIALLESKVAESAGQQAQLKLLYDEMARSHVDLVLADVETAVLLASQQLRITGNVAGALIALQDAEQALARSQLPAALGLRRVIGQDIERLRGLPVLDLAVALARLDGVIAAVDRMPLLADLSVASRRRAAAAAAARGADARTPAAAATGAGAGAAPEPARESASQSASQSAPEVAPESAPQAAPETLTDRMLRAGARTWEAVLAELAQLVRVQRIDDPGVLLLAPEQRYFVRENLRLMLLNVRSHLLARNDALLQADLARVLEAVDRFFDTRDPGVAAARSALGQLQTLRVGADMPTLAETLSAVRAERAASEAVRR